MIDELQRFAQCMRALLLPSLLVAAFCFVSAVLIVIGVKSGEFERFLTPSLIGFIWAAATFAFIVTFRAVPEKADKSQRLIDRLKLSITRGWTWLIAIVFLGTTAAAIILTGRLISIWLKDYMI